jgi:hypothetical protein
MDNLPEPLTENQHKAIAYHGTLRGEIAAIAARFEAADRRAKRAATLEDRDQAEAERLEASGDFWAAEADLADLLLMLFRLALRHQPNALGQYVYQAVELQFLEIGDRFARELQRLSEAVARLEAGK